MSKGKPRITPEQAPALADRFVQFAKSIEGIVLDYSIESLKIVDGIIDKMRREGQTVDDLYLTLIVAGCYVGQVFVRHHQVKWISVEASLFQGYSAYAPIVIEYAASKYVSPIDKVVKRLQNGWEDNLPYYYDVFRQQLDERQN